jgi:hypothetical protein
MGSSNLNKLIYDEIRKKWVKATPEEQVRQLWIQRMTCQLGYPKEILVVAKALKELPLGLEKLPDRRLDILCYAKGEKGIFPLLLIECKKGRLTDDALNQLIGYNFYIRAPFVAAVSLDEVRFGLFETIPRAASKLEFGQRESSRGSIDRKEVSINAIQTSLQSSNPGALAQSKFQFSDCAGHEENSYRFCPFMPPYQELMQWLTQS